MNTAQDLRLIAALQQRDDAAVYELAERYGSKIYKLALRYLKNPEDAEEVTQDVLMKVHRNATAFRGDAAFASWIYRITFNAAMSRLRSSRRERAVSDERDRMLARARDDSGRSPRAAVRPDWSAIPDDLLLRAQLREAIAAAIRELPEIYRAPVVLRDVEGLSTEEASQRLKVKDQTLKSRLHRGRMMLRRRLQDFADGLRLHHPTPACC